MLRGESLPDFSAMSYPLRSLNIMSNVNSNGPAFLLRISLVYSQSSAIKKSSSRTDPIFPGSSYLFEFHANRIACILKLPNVIRTEPIDRANVDYWRREGESKIADESVPFGDGMMQARVRQN